MQSAYESSLPGARLPVATLRPASAGGLGPRCSAEPALASWGQSCGAKVWGKRWTLLGGPKGLGVGGEGEEVGLGRGRGDTSQSWTLRGRAISPSPWTGRCLGSRSLEQVGLAPDRTPPPAAQCGTPQCSPEAPRSNLHMVSPHAWGTDVSSHREEMPFCFILAVGGGPPEFRAAGGRTAADQVPGAPHRGPRDVCAAGWATAEGTILPHSLCKVTLEAGTQPPAALGGPKPTPRTGQFGNP